MKITENNIIESLKSGEEQAFRYIYDKYYGYWLFACHINDMNI